jgi:AcrR family transcriptional regulator
MTDPTGSSAPSPAPGRPCVRRRARTRPALLAAGQALLARRPVDSLSVDEIVEAAGVAKGSFFYHFADKQSFAREIASAIRQEVEDEVGETNQGVVDPAERVARGVAWFVRFAMRAPDKAAILLTSSRRTADPDNALNAGLRADLDLGLATGRFNCPDRDAAMMTLIAATNLVIARVAFDRVPAAQTGALYTSVLVFVFRGLGLSTEAAGDVLDATARAFLSIA